MLLRNCGLAQRRRRRALQPGQSVAIGLAIFAILVLSALFAPWLAPHDPNKLSIAHRLQPPSGVNYFGTDGFGRDIFSRVLFAGRVSLSVGFGVAVLASLFGVALGLVGGFFRRLDTPVSRVIDAMMAFPDILLAIALVAALGASIVNVVLALSIVYAPRIARVIRAATLVIRELTYVEAARALGVSTWRILVNHILRNVASPIIVQATFVFAYAMLAEAGLSYLGVGVDASTPTWGTMINEGSQYVGRADWIIVFPGIAITLCVLSLQVAGDGLRDALDPRLSKEL
ncbi:MAG: peptide ABC transporter permease [Devosia sp. 67-54]|uniref:ABC transporter permease n=1 Tax=unclassified Devosia TaxID=196773 RepID=UPI00086F4F62|nr:MULTISPECIES: ABC transporter permease [unclassified Devosia]MBN9304672.1 ABC transporter permease [Devosia sp.]ODU55489.1 MAG: peptide ABC transporter permease [Acetobacteraceae bacterium SCN 69-10]OJX15347.1 MAG: peptide ABC transporter permease [Devosia sp. 67-54]